MEPIRFMAYAIIDAIRVFVYRVLWTFVIKNKENNTRTIRLLLEDPNDEKGTLFEILFIKNYQKKKKI